MNKGNYSQQNLQNVGAALIQKPITSIQRTQLGNLKTAGRATEGQKNDDVTSSVDLDEVIAKNKGQGQVLPGSILAEQMKKNQKRGVTKINHSDERVLSLVMVSDLFNYEELKQSANFVVKTYKDSYYVGEVDQQTNQRQGLGICKYENQRNYEGSWNKDKRHGKGYEQFSNGNVYIGDYLEGKVSGKGVYKWLNGDMYDGEWFDGQKHGYGVWKNLVGDSYIGQWVTNMAHGYGVHQWMNGDKYEGEWKHSLRHGQGSDFFANGDVYFGQYVYGVAQGYGQYKWSNGNTYGGAFINGKKQGKGIWKKSSTEQDTNCYEGEYLDDMKHGKGEFKWASGGYYKGGYIHDLKSGYGEMTWADGSQYKGQWENGVQNGVGLMIFSNGLRKAGIFKDNVLVEILPDNQVVQNLEQAKGPILPLEFKQQLTEQITKQNPTDDQSKYLKTELKKNQIEEKTQPNTLLNMQEAATAPWGKNTDFTKSMFVQKVKAKDAETQYEVPQHPKSALKVKPIEPSQLIKQFVTLPQDNGELIFHDFDYVGYEEQTKDSNLYKSHDQFNQLMNSIQRANSQSPGHKLNRSQTSQLRPTMQDRHQSIVPASRLVLPELIRRRPVQKKQSIIANMPMTSRRDLSIRQQSSRKPSSRVFRKQSRPSFVSGVSDYQRYQMPALRVKKASVREVNNSYEVYLKPQNRYNYRKIARVPSLESTGSRPKVMKTMLKGKAWIPGGHPNSVGRNKLGSQFLLSKNS